MRIISGDFMFDYESTTWPWQRLKKGSDEREAGFERWKTGLSASAHKDPHIIKLIAEEAGWEKAPVKQANEQGGGKYA